MKHALSSSLALNVVLTSVVIAFALAGDRRDLAPRFDRSGPQATTSAAMPPGSAVIAPAAKPYGPAATLAAPSLRPNGVTREVMPHDGNPARRPALPPVDAAPRVTGGGLSEKRAALAAKEESWRNVDVSTGPTTLCGRAAKPKPVTQSAADNAQPRTTDQPSPSLQRTSIATAVSETMTTTAPTTAGGGERWTNGVGIAGTRLSTLQSLPVRSFSTATLSVPTIAFTPTSEPSANVKRIEQGDSSTTTVATEPPIPIEQRAPAAYGAHGEVFRRGNEWVTAEQVKAEEEHAWRIVNGASVAGQSTLFVRPILRMQTASATSAASSAHPRIVTPPRPPSSMEWTATVPLDPAMVPAEAQVCWYLWPSANVGGGVSASEHAIPLPVGVLADYSALAVPSLCFTDGAGKLLDCVAAGARGNRLPIVVAGYEECGVTR